MNVASLLADLHPVDSDATDPTASLLEGGAIVSITLPEAAHVYRSSCSIRHCAVFLFGVE